MQEMIQTLAQYIKDTYDAELDSQENIFASGIIDSMGFVNLIGYISQEFQIELGPEDLVEENFFSLARIAEFILEKKE